VFARCGELGLHRVAHAGEEGPAAYIRTALDVLGATRIDHGVRCLEDPDLVARLARERVPLTVCPLSNVKLRVFPDLAHHPLKTLLDAGICATVNSTTRPTSAATSTPTSCDLRGAAAGARDAYALARNSFTASFADEGRKQGWVDSLDAAFAAA
jgi:adenosine deaminase